MRLKVTAPASASGDARPGIARLTARSPPSVCACPINIPNATLDTQSTLDVYTYYDGEVLPSFNVSNARHCSAARRPFPRRQGG